jgi:hypothetical protein
MGRGSVRWRGRGGRRLRPGPGTSATTVFYVDQPAEDVGIAGVATGLGDDVDQDEVEVMRRRSVARALEPTEGVFGARNKAYGSQVGSHPPWIPPDGSGC